jgi:hypothetical protein
VYPPSADASEEQVTYSLLYKYSWNSLNRMLPVNPADVAQEMPVSIS